MKRSRSVRSLFSAFLALAIVSLLGAGTALAQSSGGEQPEYVSLFNEANKVAQEGEALTEDDVAGAVSKYEQAYRQMEEAAQMAREAGNPDHVTTISRQAAGIAFKAGRLLHNNDQSEEAIAHFEFGQQVAPPGSQALTSNSNGLKAARRKLESAPVAAASEAVSAGNYQEALNQLSEVEEQTGTTYFYQAISHNRLNNTESAVSYAQRAIDAGGLSGTRRGQMYLIIGEGQIQLGDNEAARQALEQAVELGSSAVAESAQYSLNQL